MDFMKYTGSLRERPSDEEIAASERSALIRKRYVKWEMEKRAVPARYRRATFGDWRIDTHARRTALDAAMAWPESDSWCFLVSGGVGSGKTFLATATYLESLTVVSTGRWASQEELWFEHLRQMESGPAAAARYTELVSSIPLLLVDDIDTEKPSESTWLSGILRARYDRCAKTIITTNWKADEWKSMDERLYSRLAGSCTTRIALVGEDERRREG